MIIGTVFHSRPGQISQEKVEGHSQQWGKGVVGSGYIVKGGGEQWGKGVVSSGVRGW